MQASQPLILAMMLTMLLFIHGNLPSVEATETIRVLRSVLCEGYCDDEDSPVCGTDGVTYRNFCWYMNAACSDKTLSLAATDACPDYVPEMESARQHLSGTGTTTSNGTTSSCNDVCTSDYSPVCASDSQTYANPCQFTIARCQANGNLWVIDYRPCSQVNTAKRTCGLGKRCSPSQQCMMELESTENRFCVDTCAAVSCVTGNVCTLKRPTCSTESCPPQPACVSVEELAETGEYEEEQSSSDGS